MATCAGCQRPIGEGSRFCPFCGAAAVATGVHAADPWIGQVVNGKFRVEALLGQGGMGRVYRATHLTLERPVVLKILHRGVTSDPSVAQRFHREAKAASRLVHPHSIQVLDFGATEDGTLFMAMEYLQGKDLARVIEEGGAMPEARIVRIGAQILEALGEAHARGIIHRDLKPENVMVEDRRNEPDHVTVLDFGIAKISDPGPGEGKLTQAGLVCGTPQYMSPEQARGLELDPRSDLYSMGVILYQLATGKLPFDSDTPVGFLTKHISEPPAPLRQKNPNLQVSGRLEALIGRALAKEPGGRPSSADAMRAELLACIPSTSRPDLPPAVSGAGTGAGPPAPAKRRFPLLPVAIGLVVVLAAAVGIAALGTMRKATISAAKQPADPGSPASTPPPTPVPTPAPAPTQARIETAPAPAPISTQTQDPLRTVPAPAPAPAAAPGPAPPRRVVSPARKDPARARNLYEEAEKKRRSMETEAAIALYLRAEQADPGLAVVHKKLGQCYQLVGDIPRARDRYRRYLATNPPDADRIQASLDMLR